MTAMEKYEDIVITEAKRFREINEEKRKEKQNDLATIGVINVYSQLYILDSDLRKLGIQYERI